MIRAARLARGLTTAGLAAKMHVHRCTVVRWQSGRRIPAGKHRRRLEQLLGIELPTPNNLWAITAKAAAERKAKPSARVDDTGPTFINGWGRGY